MSGGERILLALADEYAGELVARLRSFCGRIEVAGSVRRRKATVGDIEIVCEATQEIVSRDLLDGSVTFRAPTIHAELDRMAMQGELGRSVTQHGSRYRRYPFMVGSRIFVDFFIVLPPATWGAILAIRTGPADYSRMLVTRLRERGYRSTDGRVLDRWGRAIPTDTEEQFFAACGVDWCRPEERG